MGEDLILEVKNLNLWLENAGEKKQILKSLDLKINKGELWGIMGESGAGKSMTMYAFTSLLPRKNTELSGEIIYSGGDKPIDFLSMSYEKRIDVMSDYISIVLQDSIEALCPFDTIGSQWIDTIRIHNKSLNRNEMKNHIIKKLEEFGINNPESVFNKYPHQLSGGMKQRIAIAMTMENHAQILICDEPTTALDTINQRKIINIITDIYAANHLTLIYITHNLEIIKAICTHVAVMRNGSIIEQGRVSEIFENPREDYTKKLIKESNWLKEESN